MSANVFYRRFYKAMMPELMGAMDVMSLVLCIAAVMAVAIPIGWLAFEIMLSGSLLGGWWLALELALASVFMVALMIPQHRRRMDVLRYEMGDELFFKTYPLERRRELRAIRMEENLVRMHRKQRRIITAEVIAFYVVSCALICWPIDLILNVNSIGVLLVAIIIALYICVLLAPPFYIRRRRDMRQVRLLMGDELFFKTYPSEYKREMRIQRRREKRANRE